MSDKPGNYEEEELRELLTQYFTRDIVSAKRIQDVLLPVCLTNGKANRVLLKEEFVRRGEAEDTQKAGYYLPSISSQMGMKKNDFLRQVIGYEYPNYTWEKDDYFIREEYRELIRDILIKQGVQIE